MVATDDGSTAAGSDSSKDTTVFAIGTSSYFIRYLIV